MKYTSMGNHLPVVSASLDALMGFIEGHYQGLHTALTLHSFCSLVAVQLL